MVWLGKFDAMRAGERIFKASMIFASGVFNDLSMIVE
jgi:hypothetical protein